MTKRSSHRHAQEAVRKASAQERRREQLERKAAKRERHKAAPWRTKLGVSIAAKMDGSTA